MTEGAAARPGLDEAQVALAASGDVSAFEGLVASRLTRAYRTASAILGNAADAEDVVQDVFIAAWRRLPTLRDRARFDAWLNTMLVNRCRDALRRRHRSREVELAGTHDRPIEDATGAVSEEAAVNAAFEVLSTDHRFLLVMHHLHQVPVADLARQLAIPEGTAKWRLHAARAALERALEAHR